MEPYGIPISTPPPPPTPVKCNLHAANLITYGEQKHDFTFNQILETTFEGHW